MASNSTEIVSEQINPIPRAEWKTFFDADFSYNGPFTIQLDEKSVFTAKSVLRIVPHRRLVAYGLWQGKPAVAKLFFSKKSSQQQVEKELNGVKVLTHSKIPTPALYYHAIYDQKVEVLIFEYIEDSRNLLDIWQQDTDRGEVERHLQNIMVELATHHVLGVIQRDLHMKNFLITEKCIYTLDGAQVEVKQQLLPKSKSIKNVALFLSQLGIGCEALQEKLFKHYARSRGWLLKREDVLELFFQIKKWNAIRWINYGKKIFRRCSNFDIKSSSRYRAIFDREYASRDFLSFLENPEAAFADPNAKILKAGNSSTVIKFTINNRELLIKRYNIKSSLHFLRRCLRMTRAANTWRITNKLALFFVPVAKPVAIIEKSYWGLKGTSYYISEYIEGELASNYIAKHRDDEHKITLFAQRLTGLLKNIAKLKIAHGDLKITNVIVNKEDNPLLIDFDGASEYVSVASLRHAWRKEIKRLMRNFHNEPVVASKFKKSFEST